MDAMSRLGSIAKVIASSIIFGAAFAALAPSLAQGGCLEWNLNSYWEFQLETGAWVGFNLTQTRWKPNSSHFELNGKATYNMPRRADGGGGLVTRLVQGNLEGNKFLLFYSVEEPEEHGVDFDGNLSGRGPTDLDRPKGYMNWHEKAGRQAECQKSSVEAETQQNPQGGVGEVLKQATPPSAEEKAGIFEQKPHKGIGDVLKETQP